MLLAPAGQEGRGGWFTLLACLLACLLLLFESFSNVSFTSKSSFPVWLWTGGRQATCFSDTVENEG